jgi:Flp pilus assembly protein TadG
VTHDRGSASVELVLVTPVVVALLLFVVFVGRVAQSRADVERAARDAARAASIARTSEAARTQGETAARATLASGGVACQRLDVAIDVAQFRAGGTVDATVTCTIGLGDLALLGVPGSRTVTSTFSEPVDTYRGIGS